MEKEKNIVVLFDVDGTLTESRKLIDRKAINALKELSLSAEIGFLSGSNLDYLKEQLWPVFSDIDISLNTHVLPCNGTEYYTPVIEGPGSFFNEVHKSDMRLHLGDGPFMAVMLILMKLQSEFASKNRHYVDFTGHHIQNRGSMINWSLIGRNADTEGRERFVREDKVREIRKEMLDAFNELRETYGDWLTEDKLTIKYGGDTSFDIYPKGWDKTYALRHFPESENVLFFVGDRCTPNGNDYELYKHLEPSGRSFITSGPDETIQIIEDEIEKQIRNL